MVAESKPLAVPDTKAVARAFVELLDKCNTAKPKAADVLDLRQALVKMPELWRLGGDIARIAAEDMIDEVKGTPALKESMKAGRIAMRKELGFDAASPLEKMLIEHVTLCWMRLELAEYHYTGCTTGSSTLAQAKFYEHRLSAVQRRYLRACETLARVRRLALPAVQVNIGEKQVNVAGG